MYDLIIKNGRVITPDSSSFKDIAVKDGKIAAIEDQGKLDPEQCKGAEVYSAEGRCVIPGLVEPHVHIKAPLGGITDIMDFDSASKCGAYGGVTTIMDFTSTLPGDSLEEAVDFRLDEMKITKQDYSTHCKVVNLASAQLLAEAAMANAKAQITGSEEDKKAAAEADKRVEEAVNARLAEIPHIIKDRGIPIFKLFMTYRKANVMIDDTYMLKVMKAVKDAGGRTGFHAESNAIAEYNEEVFAREGKLDWKYFPEYKGNICEAEAVARVLKYAEMLDAPIYFFHITTKEAVDMIRDAKKRGVDVIAETCSHYITLTKAKNEDPVTGILFLMSPPLRSQADQDALWEGLRDGTLSLVSSDNCSFTRKQKTDPLKGGPNDFRKPISGVSGIEERFGLMRRAVALGKITENEFVKLLCENPAKVFGCYPQKGTLTVGSDADICVFDPDKKWRLSVENLHYPECMDYAVYDEFEATGKPVATIRRGEFLMKDDVYNEDASFGKVLKRYLK